MAEALSIHAERVVFGTTLADKLTPWPTLLDDRAPLTRAVEEPGRPRALSLPRGHRDVVVRGANLQTETGRASVLHELANHELQAIELIALALLRWPDAPAGFRNGLVATLADEQRHCSLYLDRLVACGGEPGQVPVSRFFWDILSPVEDVRSFVAGLSLCFEAANLDFCGFWSRRFAKAGDPETAAILDQVYADEIRHVAHGHGWFRRWHESEDSAAWVDCWVDALPSPLTPARARGPRYDGAARRAAGFSPEAIAAIRVLGGSRGRPSRVFVFDAAVEDKVAGRTATRIGRTVTADLAVLPMFLARSEDVVVAPAPPVDFLNALADAGFEVPRFVPDHPSLGPLPVAALVPWGRTPEPLPEVASRAPLPPWDPSWKALSSKVETTRRAAQFADHPLVVPELGQCWNAVRALPFASWVIKAPYSTSGTARIRGQGDLDDAQLRWVEAQLARGDGLVVQPWYERVLDLSVHVEVGTKVTVLGLTRFETARGSYTGSWLGRWNRDLSEDLQRWLHSEGGVEPLLRQAAKEAGRWAQALAYRGPLSIDAMVVETPEGWRVHPWLETNARHTLGRVALSLGDHIAPRSRAFWHVQRASDSARAELAAAQEARPVRCHEGRIRSGVLPTTPGGAMLLTHLDVWEPT